MNPEPALVLADDVPPAPHAAGWFHDGSAAGQVKLGFGNNRVVVWRSWSRCCRGRGSADAAYGCGACCGLGDAMSRW
jgi:hypothetical protein